MIINPISARHNQNTSPWTKERVEFLIEHYPKKGKMWCVEQLDMLEHQIRSARETDDQRSERALKMMKTKASRGNLVNHRPQASWKAGWRTVGGQRCYFRSRWEANYARYLQFLVDKKQIARWEHEPETFWFEDIKRGCRSYLPDFRVTELSGSVVYHEVKGWMDDRSKTKIKRMRIYHPNVKLIVIEKRGYQDIYRKLGWLLIGWEK